MGGNKIVNCFFIKKSKLFLFDLKFGKCLFTVYFNLGLSRGFNFVEPRQDLW